MSVRLGIAVILAVIGSFAATLALLNQNDGTEPLAAERKFFGETSAGKKFLDEIGPPYTVDVTLKAARLDAPSVFNRTSPPTPFSIGPMIVYQRGGQYFINVEKKTAYKLANVDQWKRITFSVAQSNTARLFVDGKQVWDGPVKKPALDRVLVGKGFAQRYWHGSFKRFRIASGAANVAELTDKRNVLVQGQDIYFDLFLALGG